MTSLIKSRCPKCAEQGKDKNADNLTTYPDGHSYCFSCGYYLAGSSLQKIKQINLNVPQQHTTPSLPDDIVWKMPNKAWEWLNQYLPLDAAQTSNWPKLFWSPSEERLIFPIYDEKNNLLAWQGRYIGTEKKPKWYSVGISNDLMVIYGYGKTIVLTEDIVSAWKVSQGNVAAMPIFGSFVGMKRLTRLHLLGYDNIIVWLDYDKAKEAQKEVMLGKKLGLNIQVLVTELDPKEYSYEDIDERLKKPGP